jgi:uncharacterized protein YggE
MKTIRITGVGTASISPNEIELRFSINTIDLNYNISIEKHNEKLNEFNEILKVLGFKKEDLKTNYFNISPKYKSVKKLNGEYKEEFEGFAVNQNLTLTFDYNMDLLDKIINKLSQSTINPRLSINFTIKEKEEFKNKIIQNACYDAKQKAQILASACNQTIVGIVSIDYSFANIHLYSNTRYEESYECCKAKTSSIGNNITPTDIKSSENVTFVFEIE